jgi:SH3-like domain-containing protein
MTHRRQFSLTLIFLGMVLALAGCFGASEAQPVDEIVRTPRPTFTPTPQQPTPIPAPATPAAGAAAPAGDAVGAGTEGTGGTGETLEIPADAPIAVVNSDMVNARKRPDIASDNIIRELARGTELKIIGQSADDEWWFVCCVDGGTAWVYYSYVDTSGNVDGVPVTDGTGGPADVTTVQASQPAAAEGVAAAPAPAATAVPPTAAPAPVAEVPAATQPPAAPAEVAQPAAPTETPAPTEPPAPAFPFNLVAQEQFVENNDLVRIYLYVYQGNTALPGYTLRVTKDGAEMPVSGTSGEAAGFTWPVADPRQRFQNMKVEFPGIQPAGAWEIQLLDSGGAPAGPPATFTLIGGDQNRELYVRYEKP